MQIATAPAAPATQSPVMAAARTSLVEAAGHLASASGVLETAPRAGHMIELDPERNQTVWLGLRDAALGVENAISWTANAGDPSIAALYTREAGSLNKLLGTFEGEMNAQTGATTLVHPNFANSVKLHADIMARSLAGA